ncbi:MAG: hypothetical protein ACKO96_43210, partial [Flammeovirgaceae bacterium]
ESLKTLTGRFLVVQIGPMTVLLEFLDIKTKLMFNLLCRKFYHVTMPGIWGIFVFNTHQNLPEWLEWGTGGNSSKIKVQRSLSVHIGSDQGTYYGEWLVNGSEITVCGRAALDCEDKLILGYVENGEWMTNSSQIVV